MKKLSFNKFLSQLYAILIVSGTFLVSCGDDEDSPVSNTAPTSLFSVQSEGTVGEEIQFTDNSSDADGSIDIWAWDFGDGTTSNDQNPVHTYSVANTYEVTLEVTDNGGLMNSISKTITISQGEEENEAPNSSFSVQNEGTVGEGIPFTDNSSDADGSVVSWAWDFGDGATSSDQNPVHTYTVAGTYEISLTVTDNDGLSGTGTSTISISVVTGLLNRTITHDENSREYALYIPTSYTGEQEVPLVIYLHGAPENKETAQSTTDFTEVSEAEGFIVAYAEAASGSNDSYIWADGREGNADDAFDDVSFINFLVDELTTEFEINANKRYLCGFSNGGFLSQHIANQDNARFAAIATVSASLHQPYETTNPGRAIPMLYMYGTSDPVALYSTGAYTNQAFNVGGWTVPVIGAEAAVDYWVGINECNKTPTETNLSDTDAGDNSTVTILEYADGADGAKVKFYRVNGGGHTWPGVPSASRPSMPFGATNNDMKAGQEIWNFFNEFELN